MSVNVVNSGAGVISVSVESTPTITVSNPEVDVINVNPLYDAGTPGATGPQGPVGPGIISGGTENKFLQKNSATNYDTKWSAYTLPGADGLERQALIANGDGTVIFDYVRSTYLKIQNDNGAVMKAGTPVYPKGITGDRVLVGKALCGDSSKMPAIGILLEETVNGGTGYIITAGNFNKTVSGLSGVVAGQKVYVSATGTLTNVRPTGATNLVQNIGTVLQTNGSNIQKMKVSAIDRSNDVPNIPTGNIWAGNTSAVATATDTIYVDISSREVGIGTVTPTETLHVVGGCKIEGDFRADAIEINGRPMNSPVNGQYGAGSKLLTQFHTTGSVTAGVVYVASSSGWTQTDADSGSTSTGIIAVATNSSSPAEMLIEGSVKVSSNAGFLSASKGDVLYLSLNSGELTDDITGHTTGDFVRVCGYVINAATNEVFFSPSKEWTQL